MKTILIALGCLVLLAASQVVGADSDSKPLPVDQRLREIDLTIALHQYEKIQTELSDVRLMIFMDRLNTSGGDEKAMMERANARGALENRAQALETYRQKLRAEIRELGGGAPAVKAK